MAKKNRFGEPPPELPLDKRERVWGRTVDRRGYVYLMHIHETPFYKIGMSTDPDGRVNSVFPAVMPFEVSIIHAIPTNHMPWLERDMHWRYEEKLIRGEWYRLSPLDIEDFCSFTMVDYGFNHVPKQLMHKPDVWREYLKVTEQEEQQLIDDLLDSLGLINK